MRKPIGFRSKKDRRTGRRKVYPIFGRLRPTNWYTNTDKTQRGAGSWPQGVLRFRQKPKEIKPYKGDLDQDERRLLRLIGWETILPDGDHFTKVSIKRHYETLARLKRKGLVRTGDNDGHYINVSLTPKGKSTYWSIS
jgi:hypothetical protein